jgi:uncharacterized SAM-binding protein YcdF (DUF218 family)
MNRRLAWFLGALLVLSSALLITRESWLQGMGRMLVDTQPPRKSDMIVVLGGDWYGNRILKAAQLAKEGYAPLVLVSGSGYLYGNYEGDLAVPYAVSHGYSPEIFIKFRYPVTSTRQEAQMVVPELRRRGVKSYILVTSEFHTARAGRIFCEIAPDLAGTVVATSSTVNWDNWWKDREARKTFLMEWTKTVTAMVGM